MQSGFNLFALPFLAGVALGLATLVLGVLLARRMFRRDRERAEAILREAGLDAEAKQKELLVSTQEMTLQIQEEFDRRERELDEREAELDRRGTDQDRTASEQGRQRKRLEQQREELEKLEREAKQASTEIFAERERVRQNLERVAGLTAEDARAELISEIEAEARSEASRIARRIEDEARENAERQALNLMTQASQRVNVRDVTESTVSFIELPSDEMKGRIIGKEGRNIRALEMATGIDLVVDDTPRSILISSFDPVRREIARVSIDRLVQDGRIHPGRIEEVVQVVRGEIDGLIQERGTEAALTLGISDLQPRLARLVGQMRFHTNHGHNLMQHCLETAMIAGFMAEQLGGRSDLVRRAGLLHEIGQVDDSVSDHPILAAAELCTKYGESEELVQTIRSLHADVKTKGLEGLLLDTANRLSDNRPGARKENLAVFIERLRRLERIATGFPEVEQAYAIKAGKEIRVFVDAQSADDDRTFKLSKQIARAVEKDLNYPGQIKVSVVRLTRAVRFAV